MIGAGVAGLTCAYRLTEAGIATDVYERWPGLGGQAATLDVGDGVLLERYYHHLFTNDLHMLDLCEELGLGDALVAHEASAAIAINDRIWPFNGALDLLRFRPIPFHTRLRMGLAMLRIQLSRDEPSDHGDETARAWIERNIGKAGWAGIWGPLMRGKFGDRADQISMAWIWAKVGKRRNMKDGRAAQEAFIYPEGSFEPIFVELRRRIEAAGGKVMIGRPAVSLTRADGRIEVLPGAPDSFRRGLDPREFEPDGAAIGYDAVVCCVPNEVFIQLLDPSLSAQVGDEYLGRLRAIEHFASLTMLLELDRPLTEHYWTNVADRRCPFVGVIEQSRLNGTESTGGRCFTYLANYLAQDDELLGLDADEVLDAYEEGLRIIDPDWDRARIRRRWLFRELSAQPIVGPGYAAGISARQTPAAGLFLVNTTQIYPEDRGTNYAVRDGDAAARELITTLT